VAAQAATTMMLGTDHDAAMAAIVQAAGFDIGVLRRAAVLIECGVIGSGRTRAATADLLWEASDRLRTGLTAA
jgi:hypothetical protein